MSETKCNLIKVCCIWGSQIWKPEMWQCMYSLKCSHRMDWSLLALGCLCNLILSLPVVSLRLFSNCSQQKTFWPFISINILVYRFCMMGSEECCFSKNLSPSDSWDINKNIQSVAYLFYYSGDCLRKELLRTVYFLLLLIFLVYLCTLLHDVYLLHTSNNDSFRLMCRCYLHPLYKSSGGRAPH